MQLYNPKNKNANINLDLNSMQDCDHSEHFIYKIRTILLRAAQHVSILESDPLESCFISSENQKF